MSGITTDKDGNSRSGTPDIGAYEYSTTPPPPPPPVSDTQPPTVPTNLSATAISSSQINLNWSASSDNVAVTGYKIFRNGVQVGTSLSSSYSNTGLTANTTYTYTVSAYDGAGNASLQSSPVSATTLSVVTPPVTNKFIIGDRVHTTAKLKVRLSPTTTGKALCTQPKNAYGTVIGGPQTANGYTWWQVNYDTLCDGWSAEGWLVK